MNVGKKVLSDLKLFNDYLKWREEDNRYETWNEAVDSIIEQHRVKFTGIDIEDELSFVKEQMYKKRVLASQRNLQFRQNQVFKNNLKLFNCSSSYVDRPRVFQEAFYLLLSGCGVGISIEKRFTDKLPTIKPRQQLVYDYYISDDIEGWSNALGVLLDSFFNGESIPIFDYSLIRPKGSFISGGFIAPGSDGLKKELEIIESFLKSKSRDGEYKLRPIDCHDIVCHISNAVLSGGIK